MTVDYLLNELLPHSIKESFDKKEYVQMMEYLSLYNDLREYIRICDLDGD